MDGKVDCTQLSCCSSLSPAFCPTIVFLSHYSLASHYSLLSVARLSTAPWSLLFSYTRYVVYGRTDKQIDVPTQHISQLRRICSCSPPKKALGTRLIFKKPAGYLHTPSNWRLCSATGQSKLIAALEWISLARQSRCAQLPAKMLTQQFCSACSVSYKNLPKHRHLPFFRRLGNTTLI